MQMNSRIQRARIKSAEAKLRKFRSKYSFYLNYFPKEEEGEQELSFEEWLYKQYRYTPDFSWLFRASWRCCETCAWGHPRKPEETQINLERRGRAHRGNYHHHHYASHYR
jgi:hypothetical protein